MFENLSSTLVVLTVSSGLVVWAALSLARYTGAIDARTRLGTLWVGAVLLGGATSLPELVASGVSGFLGHPDLAVGNVLGSNLFNILILALLDPLTGRSGLLGRASPGHLLPGAVGVILAAMTGMALLARLPFSVWGVGIDTILIAAVYLFGLRLIARFQGGSGAQPLVIQSLSRTAAAPRRREPGAAAETAAAAGAELNMPLGRLYRGFIGAALVVMAAGYLLTMSAEATARITGLGQLFVGTMLLALTTSLPELVSGAAAVRRQAVDLMVGAVLGSNLFNLTILLFADIAYRDGPILAAVSPGHALTAMAGLVLAGITMVGLIYRSQRNYAGFGPDTLLILAAYLVTSYLLFTLR